MKKNMFKALATLAALAFSTAAFAATTITSDTTTKIGGAAFVPSTNVTVQAAASATQYAAQSKHLSGNIEYGTLSTDSDLKTKTVAIGETCTSPTSATELNGF